MMMAMFEDSFFSLEHRFLFPVFLYSFINRCYFCVLRKKMCRIWKTFFLSLLTIIMLDLISIRMSFISINRKMRKKKLKMFFYYLCYISIWLNSFVNRFFFRDKYLSSSMSDKTISSLSMIYSQFMTKFFVYIGSLYIFYLYQGKQLLITF